MRHFLFGVLLSVIIAIFCSNDVLAQDKTFKTPILEREELTGNWGGLRTNLDDNGFAIEVNLIADIFSNVSGEINNATHILDNIDVKMVLDNEKLFGLKGSNFLISGLQNNGRSISAEVGDVQGVNNIEAVETIRLFEVWLQQKLWDNRISVLAGLYDVNSEFDVMQSSALFINSSQGIGADFAGSGLIGPPTFPAAGLGGRIKIIPDEKIYIQAAIMDGVPGNLSSVKHADFTLNSTDGYLAVAELGLLTFNKKRSQKSNSHEITTRLQRSFIGRETATGYSTKIAFGFWSYSRNYVQQRYGATLPALTDNQNDKGIYVITDWNWNLNPEKPYQELSFFGRVGITENEVSRFKGYMGAGLTYSGLFKNDPNGQLGFSVATAQNSRLFRQLNPSVEDAETILEFTYLTNIIPWLNVQPDIQYVINPGTNPALNNAWVIGLRTDINL